MHQKCEEFVNNVLEHLRKHERLEFAKVAEIESFDLKTSFVQWTLFGQHWYQGELNKAKKWHGRGVVITPQQQLQIGTFKDGKMNGQVLVVDHVNKVLTTGKFKEGK